MKTFSFKFYNLKKFLHVAQNGARWRYHFARTVPAMHCAIKIAFKRVKKFLKNKGGNDSFGANFLRCLESAALTEVRSSSRYLPPEDRQKWTQSPQKPKGAFPPASMALYLAGSLSVNGWWSVIETKVCPILRCTKYTVSAVHCNLSKWPQSSKAGADKGRRLFFSLLQSFAIKDYCKSSPPG